jgi:hypothetical protein
VEFDVGIMENDTEGSGNNATTAAHVETDE